MIFSFFNLDFHCCIQNSQPLVHIHITMNPINTLPFRFKTHSNMILPSTARSSNFPFDVLLFTPSGTVPWISHYNVLSHLFILHTCSGVLSTQQNQYTALLKFPINMFSLYVRILSVTSTAISTPFILSAAVLCLNVFLIILIISQYAPTRKLCNHKLQN
jgi:hypothetical protein